jgi:hypothetical protein
MNTYIFSQLSEETLETLVTLNEKYTPPAEWEKNAGGTNSRRE